MQNIGNPLQIPSGREGLTDYVQSYDRNAPPYYAGRKRLLSGIEDICGEIWKKHENNLPQRKGLTRLIYGAPGVGKSSTLMYLQHAWQQGVYMTADAAGCRRSGPTPVMMNCNRSDFISLATLCGNLVNLVESESNRAKDLFAASSETKRVSGGGGAGFVKGGIEFEKTTHYDAAVAELQAVAKTLPHEKWKRPVVIGIDEAQNLPGDRHSPLGILLQDLHENRVNLPMMVLLMGLSDTKERVNELGLSRLSKDSTYSMNGLDAAEIEELKEGFCAHFEIDLGNRADEFDALLRRTDGWASHLQNALQAFAEVYLEAGYEIEAMDFARVEQLSLETRMEYYFDRLSDAMKTSSGVVGLLMKRMKGGEVRRDILSMIQRIHDDHAGSRDVGLRLPDGMTAQEFYNDLIHRGALQERNDEIVICPIPSFRQFLIEKGRLGEDDYSMRREVPQQLYYGLTWDALQRVEAAHEVRPAH